MNKCIFGDCRDSMRQLIADGVRVQMCVTSPPYWGLRDYGHAGQLGLEKTPEEYVRNMVEVFGLVRELLADDGTLWLNLGDSYARQGGKVSEQSRHWDGRERDPGAMHGTRHVDNMPGFKPKDLIGIPWRVAFALQAEGWYLRQDIIWHKPNPMPESVTDRCTKSHEYIFLLSKSARYYFDAEAIAEKSTTSEDRPSGIVRDRVYGYDSKQAALGRARGGAETPEPETRNKRSVWTVTTKPYSGAHFATFPPDLIEPCILAGSRPADIVLDPFFGSGTTGEVAQNLGRQWIGCELNQDYAPLQDNRTSQAGIIF